MSDTIFTAAVLGTDTGYLSFVLVGEGMQVVDFGVAGNWVLVTYDWTADEGRRIIDEKPVNPAAVTIDFSRYPRGFCAGYLYTEDKSSTTTTTSTTTTSTSLSTSTTTTLLDNGPGGCVEFLVQALRWLRKLGQTKHAST